MKFSIDKASDYLASKLLNLIRGSEDPLALRFAFAFAGSNTHAKATGNDPKDLVSELRSTMRMMEGASVVCPPPASDYYANCATTVQYNLCDCESDSGPLISYAIINDCRTTPYNIACTLIIHDFNCDVFKCRGTFRCSASRFNGCGQVYYQAGDGCPDGSEPFNNCDDGANSFQCSSYGDCADLAFGCEFSCLEHGRFGCWGTYRQQCASGDYDEDACEESGTGFYCKNDHACNAGSGGRFVCDEGTFHCAQSGSDEFVCTGKYCTTYDNGVCTLGYCSASFNCDGTSPFNS